MSKPVLTSAEFNNPDKVKQRIVYLLHIPVNLINEREEKYLASCITQLGMLSSDDPSLPSFKNSLEARKKSRVTIDTFNDFNDISEFTKNIDDQHEKVKWFIEKYKTLLDEYHAGTNEFYTFFDIVKQFQKDVSLLNSIYYKIDKLRTFEIEGSFTNDNRPSKYKQIKKYGADNHIKESVASYKSDEVNFDSSLRLEDIKDLEQEGTPTVEKVCLLYNSSLIYLLGKTVNAFMRHLATLKKYGYEPVKEAIRLYKIESIRSIPETNMKTLLVDIREDLHEPWCVWNILKPNNRISEQNPYGPNPDVTFIPSGIDHFTNREEYCLQIKEYMLSTCINIINFFLNNYDNLYYAEFIQTFKDHLLRVTAYCNFIETNNDTSIGIESLNTMMYIHNEYYEICQTVAGVNNPVNFDNLIDLLISVLSETNKELLYFQTHVANIHAMYSPLFEDLFKVELSQQIATVILENKQTVIEYVMNTASSRGGKKNQKGGEISPACSGDMVLPEKSDLYKGLLISGLTKTYDELLHDFHSYFNSTILTKLKGSYNAFINKKFEEFQIEIRDNEDLSKISKFINILRSQSVIDDIEWNYYTSVLKWLDSECTKLDQLTVVKVCNTDDYPFLKANQELINDGYIIKVGDKDYFYTTIDNLPVTPKFTMNDVCFRVSDNATATSKLYPLIHEILNSPKGVTTVQIDTFKASLYDLNYAPGMIDPKTTGPYNKSDFDGITESQSLKDVFTGENMNTLKKIQQMQNLNHPLAITARKIIIDGINTFMGYFGVPIELGIHHDVESQADDDINYIISDSPFSNSDVMLNGISKNIGFKVEADRYIGIQFKLDDPAARGGGGGEGTSFELHIGDTTIQTISDFVKKFNGTIPVDLSERDIGNERWNRLYLFATAILGKIHPLSASIDENNLLITQIIISFKSLGDSLQVYYAKRYAAILNDNIDKSSPLHSSLFISSTDKNVGAEAFLLDLPVWLIGTGIRPHSEFFEKYIGFFGKDSFKAVVQGGPAIEGETKIDGTKTITTNVNLMTFGKYEASIISTFSKMTCYFTNLEPRDPESNATIERIYRDIFNNNKFEIEDFMKNITTHDTSVLLDPIPSRGEPDNLTSKVLSILIANSDIFNTFGCLELITYFDKYSGNNQDISLLSEIDAFLKKAFDIVKLCGEPSDKTDTEAEKGLLESSKTNDEIAEEGKEDEAFRTLSMATTESELVFNNDIPDLNPDLNPELKYTLLFKKLSVVTNLIEGKFLKLLVETKKSDLRSKLKAFTDSVGVINSSNFRNIIDESSIEFSKKFLNQKFLEQITAVQEKYNVMIDKTLVKIRTSIEEITDSEEAETARIQSRSKRNTGSTQADKNASEEAYLLSEKTQRDGKLQKLNVKLAETQAKLNTLIAEYDPTLKKKSRLTKIGEFFGLSKTQQKKIDAARTGVEGALRKRDAYIEQLKNEIKTKLETEKNNNDPVKVRGCIKSILQGIQGQLSEFSRGGNPKTRKRRYRKKLGKTKRVKKGSVYKTKRMKRCKQIRRRRTRRNK